MRGEYLHPTNFVCLGGELPPRARRIPIQGFSECRTQGTTSACAENTELFVNPIIDYWNYLRVRGEYWSERHRKDTIMELPPRARRILYYIVYIHHCVGTTSACAENTLRGARYGRVYRNYLRVRGEYSSCPMHCARSKELPPRARRIPNLGAGS